MRKIFALLALVLGVVSCQTEPEGFDATVGGEKEVNITVALPEATRSNSALGAFGNVDFGQYDIKYFFQVFNADGSVKKDIQEVVTDAKSATFPVRLIPGRTYNFVVWAHLVDANGNAHYAIEDSSLENIVLNGSWDAMDETRDAYTGKWSDVFTGAESITITLTRPFAKLRVITNDMNELMGVVPAYGQVTYTTALRTSFNALVGEAAAASETKEHTYEIANYDENSNISKVLFTDYFFAENDVVKFDLEVYEDEAKTKLIKANNFNTDIPVKRNTLTTIAGNILTTGDNITVTVVDEFANAQTPNEAPYYKQTISSAAEFLAALNTAGEFIVTSDINIAKAGDTVSNGQVNTLATRAANETTIDLNGYTIIVDNKSAEAIATIEAGHKVTIIGDGTIALTEEATESFIDVEDGATLEIAAVTLVDNANAPVVEGEYVDYADLLRQAFEEGRDYTLVYNITVTEPYVLAAGKTMVLDLNGKTITATDTTEKNYELIKNQGTLTVKNGTLMVKAEHNNGWNRYSAVIANTVGGNLTVENAYLEHLGGTDMAYGIDNLTNGKGTSAVTTIENATVKSTYRAVRQFLNGAEATNELYVKAGAVLEGENKSIFFHDPSAKANTGKLVVEEGSTLNGDVYLFVTAGSTEWPVEVSIAASAVNGEVLSANVPNGLAVEKVNGTWTIVSAYEKTETGYAISSVAGMKWLAEAVKNGETFEGKTIELTADIDLTGVTTNGDSFSPIGLYCSGQGVNKPFKGHFNGNNHTIKGIYQSGWDFGYEWGTTGYLGLFGYAIDTTVENLTIEGMESVVEGGTLAAIAGRADGECTFKNITVKKTNLGTYNNRCGGIVGWTGGYYKDEAKTEVACYFTFENINICEDVVLGGLWGSFDSSIGGIMGQLNSAGSASFKNVTVSCRIDAYNDCTASYDYYLYRMCGMLIGQMTKTTTIDGSTYPDVAAYGITFDNVTVNYGKWMNYHYCEPTPGLNGGRGMRVEPGFAYDGLPSDFDHTQCVDNHYNCIPFDQLFGGTQTACKGVKAWEGVTVNYPAEYTCDLCGEQHNVK